MESIPVSLTCLFALFIKFIFSESLPLDVVFFLFLAFVLISSCPLRPSAHGWLIFHSQGFNTVGQLLRKPLAGSSFVRGFFSFFMILPPSRLAALIQLNFSLTPHEYPYTYLFKLLLIPKYSAILNQWKWF